MQEQLCGAEQPRLLPTAASSPAHSQGKGLPLPSAAALWCSQRCVSPPHVGVWWRRMQLHGAHWLQSAAAAQRKGAGEWCARCKDAMSTWLQRAAILRQDGAGSKCQTAVPVRQPTKQQQVAEGTSAQVVALPCQQSMRHGTGRHCSKAEDMLFGNLCKRKGRQSCLAHAANQHWATACSATAQVRADACQQ